MKTKFALIAIMALIIASCSDDDAAYKCSTCVDTPEANADFDASGKGIYKGLVVGSSGTLKLDLANSGSTYTGTLELDGETYELISEATYNSETGFSGCFYGTMHETDDIVICFYTNYNGSSYYVSEMTIPDHPDAVIEIYKELSDALVMVYEGKYKGDATGIFNMVVQENEWTVVSLDDTSGGGSEFYGLLQEGVMTCVNCGDITITGTVDGGDIISGQWSDGGDDNGTWSGNRTL